MTNIISISNVGRRWAVKHDGGYLGFAGSREEALRIGRDLVEWFGRNGRDASLVEEEPRSFTPRPAPEPLVQPS